MNKYFFRGLKKTGPTKREQLVKIAQLLNDSGEATLLELKHWLGSLHKLNDKQVAQLFDALKSQIK